jgi:hypothetical protein
MHMYTSHPASQLASLLASQPTKQTNSKQSLHYQYGSSVTFLSYEYISFLLYLMPYLHDSVRRKSEIGREISAHPVYMLLK